MPSLLLLLSCAKHPASSCDPIAFTSPWETGGYALVEGAAKLSDERELVPFGIVSTPDKPRIARWPDLSWENALDTARRSMSEFTVDSGGSALVFDALFELDRRERDVMVAQIVRHDAVTPSILVQPYRPRKAFRRFKLEGPPKVLEGNDRPRDLMLHEVRQLETGAACHARYAELGPLR